MDNLASSGITLLSSILMLGSLILVIIPAVPVTVLMWAIAMLTGVLTGFQPITIPALMVITLLALGGASAEAWLPYFGMRGKGIGWVGILAFFIGLTIGSFVIPLPILGGIIGGVVAVIGVQFLQLGELRAAIRGGGVALKFIILAMIAEGIFSILILIVWFTTIALG